MSRFAIACLLLIPALAPAQSSSPEPLKGPERAMFQDIRGGKEKVTDANRGVIEKQAKYFAGQLTDPVRLRNDSLAQVIEDAIIEFGVIRSNRPKVIKQESLDFAYELGNALVKELGPALKHNRSVVRMNAARMLYVLGLIGYDKGVEPALAMINDPKENDAVKLWALSALTSALGFEIDAALPEQSAFRKENRGLEHKSIVALCDFIMKPRDVTNLPPEQAAAYQYVRLEAVKALGFARTPRLEFGGQTLARPALVLLKVANRDGLVPEPSIKERAMAIEGFGRLFPVVRTNAPRSVQCDYAAFALGAATLDLATVKINNPADIMIPWKVKAAWIDFGLQTFAANAGGMNLDGAAAAKDLATHAKTDLLDPIFQGNAANAQGFREWLTGNKPKSASLYKDEPDSTVKPAGLQ
ncbi:MAG: hypothetical protein K1X57_03745 [Gemmataceae bacterium]|nr:hypothetical protein [Gemmataceae bacterium]